MNVKFRLAGVIAALVLLFLPDVAIAQSPEARAMHMHRATRRRTAVVVSSATHEQDQEAAAQQQAAEDQAAADQAAADKAAADQAAAEQAAAAPPPAPAPSGNPLPIGSVVAALPSGCSSLAVENVEYYHCGSDYYRSAFQGNSLVYVTTESPE